MENNQYLDIDREQEAHEYNNAQPNFNLSTVREVILPTIQDQISTILTMVEDGEINALHAFASFKKLEVLFSEAKKKVDKLAYDEAENYDKSFTLQGVDFTRKECSERLNYEEDYLCRELSEKLKKRQELVKTATKGDQQIFDENGIEVTRVSSKFDKSSLIVKFK